MAAQLDRLGIAYLHVVEPRIRGTEEIAHGQAPIAAQHLRPKFSRTLTAAGGFAPDSAEAILATGDADLVDSVVTSSPTRICPSGCGAAFPSIATTGRPSTAATRAAKVTTDLPPKKWTGLSCF
ncbi:hypothetical protein [Bradyrhizobium sp. CCGUVB23]|uniref:hypothetical protein n=1 Tax=Bradyrhizobium sp. CCGUVB23 TaxID=2949630 RepID=UPI0020B4456B|nr:hypothetical protein [Bradyrhizobium sp. CCGUVB23]MCP3464680.1 hypothetical protein [Bradyrhizobium sp. CCGUVB23]